MGTKSEEKGDLFRRPVILLSAQKLSRPEEGLYPPFRAFFVLFESPHFLQENVKPSRDSFQRFRNELRLTQVISRVAFFCRRSEARSARGTYPRSNQHAVPRFSRRGERPGRDLHGVQRSRRDQEGMIFYDFLYSCVDDKLGLPKLTRRPRPAIR